jgi:hypothetical protein
VLPIQYPRVWEMYKKAMGQFIPLCATLSPSPYEPASLFLFVVTANSLKHFALPPILPLLARSSCRAASFWTIDEVDLTKDRGDWDKMTVRNPPPARSADSADPPCTLFSPL